MDVRNRDRGRASVSANLRHILDVRDMSDDGMSPSYRMRTTTSSHYPHRQQVAGGKRYIFMVVVLGFGFLLLLAAFGIWMVSSEYDNW